MKRLVGLIPLAGMLGACALLPQSAPPPPNVILIIGDGMDDAQITIARNVLHGARGRLELDRMPQRGAVQVVSRHEDDPPRPIYVADSASTATALATGQTTSNGRIATAAGSGANLVTLVELARAGGLRSGLIATSSLTDATPAAFSSHSAHRRCENPQDMIKRPRCRAGARAAGGPGSIAEQLASAGLDLAIGGGLSHFVQPGPDGASALDIAFAHGMQLSRDAAELATADPAMPLLALLSHELMPARWIGEGGRAAAPVRELPGDAPPIRCVPNPEASGLPRLAELTELAIRRLDRPPRRGFFLMVESSLIDKAAHVRQPCSHVGELQQLDETVAVARAFARKHGNTLVLVTADHAQSAQIVLAETTLPGLGAVHSPGHFARVMTAEGEPLGIAYATTVFQPMEMHTGAQVPVFAEAPPGFALPTMLEQAELFTLMRDFLEL